MYSILRNKMVFITLLNSLIMQKFLSFCLFFVKLFGVSAVCIFTLSFVVSIWCTQASHLTQKKQRAENPKGRQF